MAEIPKEVRAVLSGASVVVRHSGVRRSGLTEIAKNRLLKCGCFLDLLFILAAVWFFPSIAYPSAHISEPFLWNLIRVFFNIYQAVLPRTYKMCFTYITSFRFLIIPKSIHLPCPISLVV